MNTKGIDIKYDADSRPKTWFNTDAGKDGRTPDKDLPLEVWKDIISRPGLRILEIGVGTAATSLEFLRERGIDTIGIEPSLMYKDNPFLNDKLNNLVSQGIIEPLFAAKAYDHKRINNGVDIVFAQGANFASYALSESDLLHQLEGIFRSLKKDNKSYLVFELNLSYEPEEALKIRTYDPATDTTSFFEFEDFLRKYKVKYQVLPVASTGRYYIKIYRENIESEDILNSIQEELNAT